MDSRKSLWLHDHLTVQLPEFGFFRLRISDFLEVVGLSQRRVKSCGLARPGMHQNKDLTNCQ